MNVVKKLLGSKKFITAAGGLVLNIVTAFLPADTVSVEMKVQLMTVITILCGCFVVGQGMADNGKEVVVAKFEGEAARLAEKREAAGGNGGE